MKSILSKVLVVDDDPRNLRIVEKALRDHFDLVFAQDGQEALETLESITPSVILLDIMMPQIDGYEVCRRIKRMDHLEMTKIVLLSGKSMTEEKLTGYQVGANDYLIKPFVREELIAKTQVYRDLFEYERRLSLTNEQLEKEVQERTQQLLSSEKMAYIGRHAAEVVHNLKNPLSNLLGNLFFLKRNDPANIRIEKMEKAVEKINDLAQSILDSARGSSANEVGQIDINQLIKEEIDLLSLNNFFKYQVRLQLDLQQIPMVMGEKLHFSQILSNLINNAVEALNGADIKEILISTGRNYDGVYVSIRDSGYGIAKENSERVFESLFTTKKPKDGSSDIVGTGLGLAFCKRMVESYDGTISFTSEVGVGTEFTVTFPVAGQSEKLKAVS